MSESDILSFHLALNDQTTSFLDDEKLYKTKKGVIFVNTSRAEIFNEKTILKGLSTGHIKHCAMDVFHEEPLPIYVIDEDIYEKQPSILIGTVDKYAQITWQPNAKKIFGLDEKGDIKKIQIYPKKSKAMNLAFDVTPAKYVTGLITEKGVCEASEKGLKELFK